MGRSRTGPDLKRIYGAAYAVVGQFEAAFASASDEGREIYA
jgi:hypothetical protein